MGKDVKYISDLIKLANEHKLQALRVGDIEIIPSAYVHQDTAWQTIQKVDEKLKEAKGVTDEDILMNPYAGLPGSQITSQP